MVSASEGDDIGAGGASDSAIALRDIAGSALSYIVQPSVFLPQRSLLVRIISKRSTSTDNKIMVDEYRPVLMDDTPLPKER